MTLRGVIVFVCLFCIALACASGESHANAAAQEWLKYYKGNSGASFTSVSRFIKLHPDFPASERLRREAENGMNGTLPDAQILQWFTQNPPQTVNGMRVYAGALSRANRTADLHRAVNTWWGAAALNRAEQQSGYTMFGKELTREAHERRLNILLHRGQYENARAVAGLLSNNHVALAEARIVLQTGKGNPDAAVNRVPSSLMKNEGLMYDRLKFRRTRGNNAGAIEILNQSPAQDAMYNADDWGKERAILVRRLFEDKKYAHAYSVSAGHKLKSGAGFADNEWMAGWLALTYLNKPWNAFEHFERLYHNVETPISKSRAAYWAGLASEKLGHRDVAQKWFSVGAKYQTTFYGQLAAEKARMPVAVSYSGTAANASVKNGAAAQAVRWFMRNGHKSEATLFIRAMTDAARTPADYAAVAEVAHAAGLNNQSIRAAQECEKNTGTVLASLAFPKAENYLGRIDFVEWALVHALIRQESRYDDQAVSSAGARGLMQLMPATAKEVAKQSGLSHQTEWLTAKPEHNVNLGSRYLRRMLDRYNGNYAMALAAYNAGPSRVDRWVGELGDPRGRDAQGMIEWIETIPIYETRNYVQRVLESVAVYRTLLRDNRGAPRGEIHLATSAD